MNKEFICLMCPNGCHLTYAVQPDGAIQVNGNRCEKGLGFAKRVFESNQELSARKIVAGKKRPVYPQETLREITAFWGISLTASFPQIMPDGSPERTLFRIVVGDEQKQRFLLEQIPPGAYHTKMKIIKTLEFLAQRKMAKISPYLANSDGQYIQPYQGGFWQIMPFIQGIPLDREKYLYEGWRADGLSRFLIELYEKSQGITFFSSEEAFSVKRYIQTLLRQVERYHPQLMPRINKVMDFLEQDFMHSYDALPLRFCHGDYHPLNIIWGKDDVLSVIDWEFLGMKPEIYDLANMVGCLGMEHPSSLSEELVVGLLRQMKAAGGYSATSIKYLLEFVLALRFAWLSEWLRKDDGEMVMLELDYMELLIENKDKLRKVWGI